MGPFYATRFSVPGPALPPPSKLWTRIFVFETRGYCKDMDLMTRDGETVGPLPATAERDDRGEALHRKYNTRYEEN